MTRDEELRQAARDYLAHDGSGIGLDRENPWRGDYDAAAMLDARRRLRAALAVDPPWDVACECGHRYARHVAESVDMGGFRPGCLDCACPRYRM